MQDSAQVTGPNPGQGRHSFFARYMGARIAVCRSVESSQGSRLFLVGPKRVQRYELHQYQRINVINVEHATRPRPLQHGHQLIHFTTHHIAHIPIVQHIYNMGKLRHH
jgi:hypothetical protein